MESSAIYFIGNTNPFLVLSVVTILVRVLIKKLKSFEYTLYVSTRGKCHILMKIFPITKMDGIKVFISWYPAIMADSSANAT